MNRYFQRSTHAAPLAVFRIALGLLLFGSILRFWANGWIEDLYITPKYYFPFFGFEFIKPLGTYTYILFAVCGLSALMVALGFFYRVAAIVLFTTFTYIELIDKSTYLNHYYFVSMICLMLMFLPAHCFFSIDARRNKNLRASHIPQWNIDVIKLFVCLLYFFAGLAKLNSDWLLQAQPLRIWLPAKNDLPLIGPFFNHVWVAYALSWLGCAYDLAVPFLLFMRSTRGLAYVAVIIFHCLTALLFPIGMFPYIMIATGLIFFSGEFHMKVLSLLSGIPVLKKEVEQPARQYIWRPAASRLMIGFLVFFFVIQIALPFRYLFYPGELFWTEEGYRFSWRVMLMEKAGHIEFTVKDADGKQVRVDNREFLTALQEKMVSTQPDMMLQYAHILKEHYIRKGFRSPGVYVDSYVALNGRFGKPLVDSMTDLGKEKESFGHKAWILPFHDEIKGF
jgi:hypothetical protein